MHFMCASLDKVQEEKMKTIKKGGVKEMECGDPVRLMCASLDNVQVDGL